MKNFSSLRYRLLALVLIPLILLSGTVMLLAYQWSSDYTYQQLFTKVNTDLRVASDAFTQIQDKARQQLLALANSSQLRLALENNSEAETHDAQANTSFKVINDLLSQQANEAGFNYLNLLSSNGAHKMGVNGWQGHQSPTSPLSSKILASNTQTSLSGIEIVDMQVWQQQTELQVLDIEIPVLYTERAEPTLRTTESRAMMIRALQSVYDRSGRRVAILEAGLLLNNNVEFVDRIRELVYGPGSLTSGGRGTVTVFFEDIRITTNVMLEDGSRALGTRVSSEVRDAVLERGETWVDRAFVVNDWYISAYEPIVDVSGERVGMLYTGFLEKPFREQFFKAIAVLSALVVSGSVAAAGAAVLGARSIFSPIENISAVVRATARGDYKRIGPLSTGTEIGELAFQFDAMLDNLEQHRQRIERDAQELEHKVQQRTEEIELQNQHLQDSINLLQQTRQRLASAEKLAALGEFTAGVAHEINNPTAVILGNMQVVVSDLGDRAPELATETDLIFEQVYRIRAIVESLLQYSRSAQQQHDMQSVPVGSDLPLEIAHPSTRTDEGRVESVRALQTDIDELVNDTITMLAHELKGRQITVHVNNQSDLAATIDRQECQQVLINLISNAIHAIEQDGKITIVARNLGTQSITLQVVDTGRGIESIHLDRVFDPFFTVGKALGTGLGLSVSYSIVRRNGGDIAVTSELLKGSIFTVTLPAR